MCEFLRNDASDRAKLTLDDMFLFLSDLKRLVQAANLSWRDFLKRLEDSNEHGERLAQSIRNTRHVLRPLRADDAFLLAQVLNLKRETLEALCKEESFGSKLACTLFNSSAFPDPFFRKYPQIFEIAADAVKMGINARKGLVFWQGRVIAHERRTMGLTQDELARLAKISRSRLANIETGRFSLTSPAAARRYDRDVQKLIRTLEKIEKMRTQS